MEKISLILKEFGILIIVGLVGGGILIYGLWEVLEPEKARVEIVSGEQHTANSVQLSQIVVDVAGAVEKPGVYKLPSGSRVGDTLVVAGGLSEFADREWVAKTLNLAKEVKDQEKIYIPSVLYKDDPSQMQGKGSSLGELGVTPNGRVNINTASVGELDGLAGIGEVRAKAIVDNRPYASTEEIVTKAKVPSSVYEEIKDQISVY